MDVMNDICWKPIETAPTDGRWIIAAAIDTGCYEVFIASYGMRTSWDNKPCWFRPGRKEKAYPTHWLMEFDAIELCDE